ncbi:hypothetical protein [Corallococcus exercitus]|uniref:hypothetical protein n=1 Tax=Corallococcus exercitus TaxID=2316736 RepID=UPI001ABF9E61|nr:hypothetical protein [Corallococcus exercitus]
MDGSSTTCRDVGLCHNALVQPSEPQSSAQPTQIETDDAERVCRAPVEQAQG